jgi:hypothetical protein
MRGTNRRGEARQRREARARRGIAGLAEPLLRTTERSCRVRADAGLLSHVLLKLGLGLDGREDAVERRLHSDHLGLHDL